MEEQNTQPLSTREQLFLIMTAIIVAGIASNYSTTCPSTSHIYVAKGVVRDIFKIVLKWPSVSIYIKDYNDRHFPAQHHHSINLYPPQD